MLLVDCFGACCKHIGILRHDARGVSAVRLGELGGVAKWFGQYVPWPDGAHVLRLHFLPCLTPCP